VRDLYAGERAARELSRMGAIMSLAPVAAPVLGGIVQIGFGWRANFVIVFAVGLSAAAIAWRFLPETLAQRGGEPVSMPAILRNFRAISRSRPFRANLGIIACAYAGMFAWISGSPFVLQDVYGLSAFTYGIAFAVACLGAIGGGMLAAPLVMRIGLDHTIGLGVACLGACGLAMLAGLAFGSAPVVLLVLSMVLYYAGLMLTMPQAIAAALTPFPDRAGSASSLIGFVQQTSAAAIGILVGQVLGQSAWPLALSIAMMGGLSLVLWAGSRQVRRQGAPTVEASLVTNPVAGIRRKSAP
jgi:DHA1 family bicyclomycin/chloramphenicol resistance-like MFS transporter